jgi:RimJ/RimL family protein N-acetyltransferase
VDHNGEVTATGADSPHRDFVPVADARPEDTAWPAMSWPPPPDTVLAGRVVAVAPVDPDRDAEALFGALDDDRVWEHLPFRVSDPGSYAQFLRGRIQTGWFPWVVRLQVPYAGLPAGAVVGTSSYLDIAVHDARLEIGATAYRHDVWATAVNPETKLLLLGYAFDDLRAGRVQLKTDVRNRRSQRAIARLGARYEGTLGRYQRRADGTVRDTVLFSVLAEDWPRVKDGLHTRLATSAQMASTGPKATAPIPASRVEE